MDDVELVYLTRGDQIDCIHRGHAVMVDENDTIVYAAESRC